MPDKWFNRTNYDFSIETNRLENANELFLEKNKFIKVSASVGHSRGNFVFHRIFGAKKKKKKKIQ